MGMPHSPSARLKRSLCTLNKSQIGYPSFNPFVCEGPQDWRIIAGASAGLQVKFSVCLG